MKRRFWKSVSDVRNECGHSFVFDVDEIVGMSKKPEGGKLQILFKSGHTYELEGDDDMIEACFVHFLKYN